MVIASCLLFGFRENARVAEPQGAAAGLAQNGILQFGTVQYVQHDDAAVPKPRHLCVVRWLRLMSKVDVLVKG